MKKQTTFRVLTAVGVMLAVVCCGAQGALVYVDAERGSSGNTVNDADSSPTNWAVLGNTAPPNDNQWGQRTSGPGASAYGTDAWQAQYSESAPTIRTTVTGLAPSTIYTGMRLYFIGKEETNTGNEWYIDGSADGSTFTTFKDGQTNANPVNTSNGGVGTAVTPSGDVRYYVTLPDAATDASGDLSVWVRQGAGANNRTVYDGIAYDNVPLGPVPTPDHFAVTVDIGPENQRVQTGHVGAPDPAAGSTPDNGNNGPEVSNVPVNAPFGTFFMSISDTNALGGDQGGIDWRDRGNSSNVSGPTADLVMLGEDLIKNNSGIIRLTLDGLAAGQYNMTSYHIDPGFSQSNAINVDVQVNTGSGFVNTGAVGDAGTNVGLNSLTASNIGDSKAEFSFIATGSDPVVIIFDGNPSGDNETPLNGFRLQFTPAGGSIPEPMTMLAVGLGISSLGGYVRKRRRA